MQLVCQNSGWFVKPLQTLDKRYFRLYTPKCQTIKEALSDGVQHLTLENEAAGELLYPA